MKINKIAFMTVMIFAVSIGYAGENINNIDIDGRSMLGSACEFGQTQKAVELINLGADVNLNTTYGTPLELAIRANDKDLIEALIKAGAHLNCIKKNVRGGRPSQASMLYGGKSNLDIAIMQEDEAIEYLKDNKNDLDADEIAYYEDKIKYLHDIVELLRSSGAKSSSNF